MQEGAGPEQTLANGAEQGAAPTHEGPPGQAAVSGERAGQSLEQALTRFEGQADQTFKAASNVLGSVRRVRGAAHQGRLRELRAGLDAARRQLQALDQEVANLAESWNFDEDAYFQSGAFADELIAEGGRQALRISLLDNRLYSYPALVRVLAGDRAVMIDKARERRLRPSVLVGLLRDLQQRPSRFRPAEFLDALHGAYRLAQRPADGHGARTVVPLVELYEVLTLLPGNARDYSRQEFTRDVYLLDQSGQVTTRTGERLEFHASTGTRLARGTLSIVTQAGSEKRYWGVSFAPAAGARAEERR